MFLAAEPNHSKTNVLENQYQWKETIFIDH